MKKLGPKVDDKTMKNLIVGKYGFVDKEDDTRYHRPTLRKDVRRNHSIYDVIGP